VRSPREHLDYHLLLLVTLALVAFGLVMVYSASSARALLASGDSAFYLKRQALYAVVGLAALVALSRVDFRRLRFAAAPLLAGSFVLLLAVLVLGTEVNGAR
jgi:cell division protein FtsW